VERALASPASQEERNSSIPASSAATMVASSGISIDWELPSLAGAQAVIVRIDNTGRIFLMIPLGNRSML
jgi:hypothetical protein